MKLNNKRSFLRTLIIFWAFYFTAVEGKEGESEGADPDLIKRIEDYITQVYLPSAGNTNLALSIVGPNGLEYTTGFGFANQEKGIPNTNKTQFLVASITKSFTSAIVVKVLSEMYPELGEEALDTPIKTFLPDANFTMRDRYRTEQVTFRDLLSHRVCTFREDIHFHADPFPDSREVFYRQRYAEPICSFRSRNEYNNPLYTVAGELIALVAKSTYNELFANFLADLGMSESALIREDDDYANLPQRAMPYYIWDNISIPFNTELLTRYVSLRASAGLFTTPNDMVTYINFHLSRGKNRDGIQVISEEAMKWLSKASIVSDQMAYKDDNEEGSSLMSFFAYGLGLSLGSYDGWRFVQHGGHLSPYFSLMSIWPGKNIGIFTSSNQGRSLSVVELHTWIYEVLNGADDNFAEERANTVRMERVERENNEKAEREKIFRKSLKKLKKIGREDVVGEYGSGSQGEVTILEMFDEHTNSSRLFMDYGRWAKGWLVQEEDNNLYHIEWVTDVVQDSYAEGKKSSINFAKFGDDSLVIIANFDYGPYDLGIFKKGVKLDNLPDIPWDPNSC